MNIEQWKCEERVRLAILKHRGNVLKVSEKLNLDLQYVKKINKKLIGQSDNNVNNLISQTLSSHILLGYESRVNHLVEMLDRMDDKHGQQMSNCCYMPFRFIKSYDPDISDSYVCEKCNETCVVIEKDSDSIYKLKIELIEKIREEDKLLIDFAEKMGYTNQDKTPAVIDKSKHNTIVIQGNDAKEIVRDIDSISPQDRQKLRKQLEDKIVEPIENDQK